MQTLVNIINRIQNYSTESEPSFPDAITTDFDLLDRVLSGGFSKASLNIIACPETVGKSAFLVSLMLNMMKKNVAVGLISLNMSEEELLERMLSNLTEIDLWEIKRGRLEEYKRNRLSDLSRLKVFDKLEITAPGYITIDGIINTCIQWVLGKKVQIIVIDYLQLISIENTHNKKLRIFNICQTLKKLSVDLNVPIILAVEIHKVKNSYSYLEDLRRIGAIVPFADVILYLNNETEYNFSDTKISEKIYEKYLRICKNRNGSLDTIKLRSLLHIQYFENSGPNCRQFYQTCYCNKGSQQSH